MTKKELSQLYYLNREISQEETRLTRLEEAATDTSVKITGLPHVGSISDKTALAAEIADARTLIEAKKLACVAEYNRLIRYINSVQDSQMRQILMLRYAECRSWVYIAHAVGNSTSDGLRMLHDRFLKKFS